MAQKRKPGRNTASALLAQREAVIAFGRKALAAADLQDVLEEACRLTSEALGTEFSKVMKLVDDGRALLVVAGTGWEDGIVGKERIPAIAQSSEGFALKTGKPAVSEDEDEEERFDYADFLKRHGVKAIVNVVIPGSDGQAPYGLLQVDSHRKRRFNSSDIEFLQSYANLLGAAIERFKFQQQLADALKTQERLYAELQHRINNSLAVVTALLHLKASRAAHPEVKQQISDVRHQVDVLKNVYKQLHASGNVNEVDLGGHLSSLCTNVINFNARSPELVRLETSIDPICVESECAGTLGLVVNEFVTNSIKHAPEEGDLTIRLDLRLQEDELCVALSDDGIGIGDVETKREARAGGSGLLLIEGLLRQLGAEWKWQGDNGTRLSVSVPLEKHGVRRIAENGCG